MLAKRQEFWTLEHGPIAQKISHSLTPVVKAKISTFYERNPKQSSKPTGFKLAAQICLLNRCEIGILYKRHLIVVLLIILTETSNYESILISQQSRFQEHFRVSSKIRSVLKINRIGTFIEQKVNTTLLSAQFELLQNYS